MNNSTFSATVSTLFDATVAYVTPLANTTLETGVELLKCGTKTLEVAVGASLQVAVSTRMGLEALASVTATTTQQAEDNTLAMLQMFAEEGNTNGEDKKKGENEEV